MADEKQLLEEGSDDEIVGVSIDDTYYLPLRRGDLRGAYSQDDFARDILGGAPSIPPAERRY